MTLENDPIRIRERQAMADDYFCKQCTFEKPAENGVGRTVCWINEKSAKIGKRVEFKDLDEGSSKEGIWTVVGVGSRKHIGYLREHETDYRRTRKASDI